MNMKDLFTLSDALFMELFISKTGKITGETIRRVTVPELSLKLNVPVKIVSSYAGKEEHKDGPRVVLVLAHVLGDLYIFASLDRKQSSIQIDIIDRSKMDESPQGLFESAGDDEVLVGQLVRELKNAAVAQFWRSEWGTVWLAGSMPKAA